MVKIILVLNIINKIDLTLKNVYLKTLLYKIHIVFYMVYEPFNTQLNKAPTPSTARPVRPLLIR